MDLVRALVGLGRGVREKERIKVRQPLYKILVDGKYEDLIGDMTDLIKEELNVKEVVFEKQLDEFMDMSLKPNFKVAGPALGAKIKSFGAALSKLDPKATIAMLDRDGQIAMELDGEEMIAEKELFDVKITAKPGFAVAMENNVFVILDTTITPELKSEGLAREMISKVQQLRKQKDFDVADRICIYCHGDEDFQSALEEHKDYIMNETLAVEVKYTDDALQEYDLNGHKTGIDVERLQR